MHGNVDRDRDRLALGISGFDSVKPVGLVKRQRPQQNRTDEAYRRGRRTDRDSDGEDHHGAFQ
jgi:hypothetical protein